MSNETIEAFCHIEPAFKPLFAHQVENSKGEPINDLHAFVASKVYKLPIEDCLKGGIHDSYRDAAKIGLFIWLYSVKFGTAPKYLKRDVLDPLQFVVGLAENFPNLISIKNRIELGSILNRITKEKQALNFPY